MVQINYWGALVLRIIRIFFTKTGEASYISHLDLQRVMARALRKSQFPAWYSKGFNPHIYMSFALPLPLMQESVAETMDCKTEAEQEDFSNYIDALNGALPKGLVVKKIEQPVYAPTEIATALYQICYIDIEKKIIKQAVEQYNASSSAKAIRKTKRSESEVDLRSLVSDLTFLETEDGFTAILPAGNQVNLNPEILVNYLEGEYQLPAGKADILRKQVFAADGKEFC